MSPRRLSSCRRRTFGIEEGQGNLDLTANRQISCGKNHLWSAEPQCMRELPERAPWLQDFQTEILQFPAGKHDDQIDSLSQFLKWITKPRHYGPQIRWL